MQTHGIIFSLYIWLLKLTKLSKDYFDCLAYWVNYKEIYVPNLESINVKPWYNICTLHIHVIGMLTMCHILCLSKLVFP